jgi:hypothetical protein
MMHKIPNFSKKLSIIREVSLADRLRQPGLHPHQNLIRITENRAETMVDATLDV